MKMSLAQALRKRAELIANIQTLQQRVMEATNYVEGRESYSKTDYDSMGCDLKNARSQLTALKVAIDKGNHVEQNGKSVYQCIVERGDINAELMFATQLRNTVQGVLGNRYGYDENENAPKTQSRVTVKDMDAAVDALQKKMRDIDNEISDKNGSLKIEVDL